MTILQSVMNSPAVTIESDQSVAQAARLMSEHDIGNVIVTSNGRLSGIVTDRDLAVRILAENLDGSTQVSEVCTDDPACLSPQADVEDAVRMMREQNVRRLPVVDGERVVGAISLGDIAQGTAADAADALADISSAPANN